MFVFVYPEFVTVQHFLTKFPEAVEVKWGLKRAYHSVSLPAPPAGVGNRESSANMVAEAEPGYMENKGTNFDNRTPPLEGKAVMSGKGEGWERQEGRCDPGLSR